MNTVALARKTISDTNVLYAYLVPQTNEWVLTEHHRISQWNKSKIKWVKIVRQWDKRQSGKYGDKITQTITGWWTTVREYINQNLPMCTLISDEMTINERTMVVEWMF